MTTQRAPFILTNHLATIRLPRPFPSPILNISVLEVDLGRPRRAALYLILTLHPIGFAPPRYWRYRITSESSLRQSKFTIFPLARFTYTRPGRRRQGQSR